MGLSVFYDRQMEPVITFAFDTGRWITDTLDTWVAGNSWGQIAVNHLRERVNMTHVVLSIPAIIIAAIYRFEAGRLIDGSRAHYRRSWQRHLDPRSRHQSQNDLSPRRCSLACLYRAES